MDTCQTATWLSVWPKTGALGKQVILSELMEQARPPHPFRCHKSTSVQDSNPAREALGQLLDFMKPQADEGVHSNAKASLTHKAMCLAALMTSYAPATDLTAAALRQIYHRLDDHELSNIAQAWKESHAQGQTTVYYAAQLFNCLCNNSSHATHYAMPVYLLRATLTLWLYARLFHNSDVTGFKTAPGTTIQNPVYVNTASQWTAGGFTRIWLPRIPELLSLQGRRELLSEAIAAMQSLSCWGVSKVYLHLLRRLQTSEAAAAAA